MCLAIPMRIVSIDGYEARCEAKGIARTVSLFLLQHEQLAPGDAVLVHVGYAIQKVSEDAARATWALLEAALDDGAPKDDIDAHGGGLA
jgi:hydrogenase expression/formation protein HypC